MYSQPWLDPPKFSRPTIEPSADCTPARMPAQHIRQPERGPTCDGSDHVTNVTPSPTNSGTHPSHRKLASQTALVHYRSLATERIIALLVQCQQRTQREERQAGGHTDGEAHAVDVEHQTEDEGGDRLHTSGECVKQALSKPVPARSEDRKRQRTFGDRDHAVAGAVQQGEA